MLSDLADRLKAFFRRLYGGSVKTVIYGSPDLIPTTAQPAIIFNAQTVGRVPTGATKGVISITYAVSCVTSYMADCSAAAAAAQSFLWAYDAGRDAGVYPKLLTRRNSIIIADAMRRGWVLTDVGAASFRGYDAGRNYLGVADLTITIQTIIDL